MGAPGQRRETQKSCRHQTSVGRQDVSLAASLPPGARGLGSAGPAGRLWEERPRERRAGLGGSERSRKALTPRSRVMRSVSAVSASAAPWTVAPWAPLSMGFSRPEPWSGVPCLPPGDLPDQGIEPGSPESQADSLRSHSHFKRSCMESGLEGSADRSKGAAGGTGFCGG